MSSSSFVPPTLAGFTSFIAGNMGISATVLPPTSEWIGWAFTYAQNIVNPSIALASSLLYALAIYNLAGDFLVNYAPDGTGQNFFTNLRQQYKLNSFVPGVVQSTSDNGTSTSLQVSEALAGLTLADLQLTKTPWGRAYLAIAQKYGDLWGIT